MNGIFISYRREDSAGHAGRLFDRLAAHFGKGMVFMDVEGIEAGVDFVETIEKAVGGCDVLLAVIGRGWLDSRDGQGGRRLDDPQDFIRLETSSALARKVRVIPVLVEGAQIPRAEDLPQDLRTITRRQALELRDSRWEDDIQALIGVLERVLASSASRDPASASTNEIDRRELTAWAWKGGAAALVLGGALIGYQWWPHDRDAMPPPMSEAPPTADIKPEVPAVPAPPKAEATAKLAAPKPATQKATPQEAVVAKLPTAAAKPEVPAVPAPPKAQATANLAAPKPATEKATPQKPVVAKLATPATPAQPADVQPAPVPAETAPPQPPPPKTALAKPAPTPEPAPPRKVAVIALGEPTYRDFWEGERKAAYSAKIAGLYRNTLREMAAAPVEFNINIDNERDLRGLEKALRESSGLCESTRAGAVFVARVEESQAISRAESAYWPELRLTAIACDSGKQYNVRGTLSPRRDDGFPFERGMAETMERFAREYRHLLQ